MPHDPRAATAQRHESPTLAICSFDASPRLGQRGLGVPEPVVDLHDVRAVIRGEHLGPDEVVTDESARDRVPVRGAATIHVDVRLNREPLAGVEAVGEVHADGHHGHRGLVSEPRRIRREIAPVELRVLAAEPDELDVRETKADRVDPHEQLIV